jgi:hypothetical protein
MLPESPPAGKPDCPPLCVQDYLQAALECRAWGWSVVPVGRDKRPVGRWKPWQQRRPTDRELGALFANSRVRGLAVVLGHISGGLACRDFDTVAGYQTWAAAHSDLARTLPTVRTRRGFHVYCRLREELYVDLGDGELRADARHFTVLPPSEHPDGGIYRWLRHPQSPGDFPDLDATGAGLLPHRPQSQSHHLKAWVNHNDLVGGVPLGGEEGVPPAMTAAREAVLRCLPHGPGQRHHQLLRLARGLMDVAPGVSADYWRDALLFWWTHAKRVVRTTDFGVSWAEFVTAWETCPLPASQTPPRRAFREAADRAAAAGPMAALTAGCRALAGVVGDVFSLSERSAAEGLGLKRPAARSLLHEAERLGVLEVVRRGLPSPTRRVPTAYRLGPAAAVPLACAA